MTTPPAPPAPERLPTGWRGLLVNPFQLFFPLGIFFGLVGVGQWVFWSVGWAVPNVSYVHAGFMAQGFLTSFVVGFLLTAFPRFTGTSTASSLEVIVPAGSLILFFIGEARADWVWAQLCYLGAPMGLLVFAIRRVWRRTKDFPPPFLLIAFGFLHALVGPTLMAASRWGSDHYPLFFIGKQMVQVGFLLCVVLGVTGKLAPFLLGHSDAPSFFPKTRTARVAPILHALVGGGIFLSYFWNEQTGPGGAWVRALLASGHLAWFSGFWWPRRKRTTWALFFHTSLWMIPIGLWVAALWPGLRVAGLHLVFLGGYSLMIFSFGAVIVLSHSHKAMELNLPHKSLTIAGALVLLAAALRFAADLWPAYYLEGLHAASGIWVIAALVWGVFAFSKMFSKPPSIKAKKTMGDSAR